MGTVNYLVNGEGALGVNYRLSALNAKIVSSDETYYEHIKDLLLNANEFFSLKEYVKAISVSNRFKDVINTFDVKEGTPAGFRVESELKDDGLLEIDLVRDISYDKNGAKRPTTILFSADSANPYEVAPIAPLIANLTCNPGIVYDLFINNPEANVDHLFNTREEVMTELGKILGPGCDISVELNNPFEEDFGKILEECEQFKEMLSEYRLVIKVPHTGPVNSSNYHELLEDDKKLSVGFDHGTTKDALRGHNLALKLREHGYRINYTLMFEPYQTAMALQAKPYFINSFIRHRAKQTGFIKRCLDYYGISEDPAIIKDIRKYMLDNDYLPKGDIDHDLLDVLLRAKDIVKYRNADNDFGSDGLDGVRHNLRLLRQNNLPDTRLIICSMEGEYNYPDIDNLLSDPEYADIVNRIIVTAEPGYLARFTSTNQVVSYQRRFLNAVNNDKKSGN